MTRNNVFQGQSFLQQTNRQNAELNQLPQEAFPQSFDQKQPQNDKSGGFGSSGGGFGISLKSGQFKNHRFTGEIKPKFSFET